MAIIKCPKCQNVMSDLVSTCPTCGYNIETKTGGDASPVSSAPTTPVTPSPVSSAPTTPVTPSPVSSAPTTPVTSSPVSSAPTTSVTPSSVSSTPTTPVTSSPIGGAPGTSEQPAQPVYMSRLEMQKQMQNNMQNGVQNNMQNNTPNPMQSNAPKKSKKPLIIGISSVAVLVALVVVYFCVFAVKSVTISSTDEKLKVGNNVVLQATVEPSRALFKNISWKSSNESIATVNNGTVVGVASGECVITGTTFDRKTVTCKVKVMTPEEVHVEAIDALSNYVKTNADASDDGVSLCKVSTPPKGNYYIGSNDEKHISLYYAKDESIKGIDVEYGTFVFLTEESAEKAIFSQKNEITLTSYNTSATTTGNGVIDMKTYKPGDKITIDSIESTLGSASVTSDFQNLSNDGAKICITEFNKFLKDHPEIGYTIEDYGFESVE